MTIAEFSEAIVFVASCIQKPATGATMSAYFQMLGHIPHGRFLVICKRVVARHVWNTFPSVAEFLKEDAELDRDNRLTGAEAFSIASEVATRVDPGIRGPYRVKINGVWKEYDSQLDYVMSKLDVPCNVKAAIRVFGIDALCNTDEPIGVTRAHFVKTFDQMQEREQSEAILPPEARKPIGEIQKALGSIGAMP